MTWPVTASEPRAAKYQDEGRRAVGWAKAPDVPCAWLPALPVDRRRGRSIGQLDCEIAGHAVFEEHFYPDLEGISIPSTICRLA